MTENPFLQQNEHNWNAKKVYNYVVMYNFSIQRVAFSPEKSALKSSIVPLSPNFQTVFLRFLLSFKLLCSSLSLLLKRAEPAVVSNEIATWKIVVFSAAVGNPWTKAALFFSKSRFLKTLDIVLLNVSVIACRLYFLLLHFSKIQTQSKIFGSTSLFF